MVEKGKRTRADIIRKTADLFNKQGFLNAPISAVIKTTGIQKGGLYRHFESREALAHAAFDHAVGQIAARLLTALSSKANACDKLLALLESYDGDERDAPLPGGCPIMNSAIESDHADEALRRRAQDAMNRWRDLLAGVVAAGQKAGEIRPEVDANDVAVILIAAIEGGVMMTQLSRDPQPLQAVRRHLQAFVEGSLRANGGGAGA